MAYPRRTALNLPVSQLVPSNEEGTAIMPMKQRLSMRSVALVALLGLVVVTPLGSRAQEKRCDCDSRKQYYLSTERVTGAEVGRVCNRGFHMASLWEILDTSNLKYASQLGLQILDQGSGPPSGIWGWVRTGWTTTAGSLSGSDVPGMAHCFLWTSNSDSYSGTIVRLNNDWTKNFRSRSIEPWQADAESCDNKEHVWCAED